MAGGSTESISTHGEDGSDEPATSASALETLAAAVSTTAAGEVASRPVSPVIARGATIARYLVVAEVGRGANGRVYSAYDADLDRRIAIKVIGGSTSEERRRTLLGEAQALAKVRHPNVVAIHDVGTHEGALYLAMEFFDGQTLRAWCHARERSWQEVLEVLLQAGRGLAAAHACGVVHGDVKPDNVLVGPGGVRVVDFGLARSVGEASPTSARPAGTPGYMAPEVWSGRQPDAASDQFGFAVMAFEALWGVRPFRSESVFELGAAIVEGRIEAPAVIRGPRRVYELVRQALAVDPAARHPSVEALLDALKRSRDRRWPIAARTMGFAAAAVGVWVAARAGDAEESECQRGAARVEEVWTAERRDALRLVSAEVTEEFAQQTLTRTRQHLDDYGARWASSYDELCPTIRAARADDAVAAARGACLEARLDALAGLVAFVETHEVSPLHSDALLETLPKVDECGSDDILFVAPVVSDPLVAAEVSAIGALVAERTREMTNDRPADLDALTELVERARATGHARSIASTLSVRARARFLAGSNSEAQHDLEAALAVALGAADDVTALAVATRWLTHQRPGLSGDPEPWFAIAHGLLRRLGDPPAAVGEVAFLEGRVLLLRRELPAAATALEASVDALRTSGDWPRALARSLVLLASVYLRLDREAESIPLLREAEDQLRRTSLLRDLPALYTTFAHVARRAGDLEGAERYNEQAFAAALHVFAPGTPGRSTALYNAALEDIGFGRLDRAEARLTESKAAWPYANDPMATAEFHFADAMLAIRRRRYQDALAHGEAVATASRQLPETAMLRAPAEAIIVRALRKLGRHRDAIARAEQTYPFEIDDEATNARARAIAADAVASSLTVGDRAGAALWLARVESFPPSTETARIIRDETHLYFLDRRDPAAVALATDLRRRMLESFDAHANSLTDVEEWLAGTHSTQIGE